MNKKIKLPNIGLDEVEVVDILVKKEDIIKKKQPLILVEGDKVSMEIPSPFSGKINEILVNIGDKIKHNSLIMVCENNENKILKDKNNKILENYSKKRKKKYNYIHASPIIRKMIREYDISIKNIKGSGRKGRIIKEDILKYISNNNIINNNKIIEDKKLNDKNLNEFGKIEIININKIKQVSGFNLHQNWLNIPHVTQFDEADITETEKFRKSKNLMYNKNNINVKITLLSFIVKIISESLIKFPIFNSSITKDNKKIIIKKYINIGIAVNTKKGLLVPIIFNVNNKNIIDIYKDLLLLSEKARNMKITKKDITGGCFTISNLGSIGGNIFTPIINSPEVAILGISKSLIKPLWKNDKFIPRLMLPLSLSYDHRVIDGVDGAKFITYVKECLFDIRNLLL
ncbi:2-oxo acid dehydrogenase subunit E2 [Candidatus Annandia adelgestsuga]|uniref:2-oxo acid dehydrogenase subunit E2 n=1 Tax=Candidatus Annandia adelgestsuga TaxID=1302411 RepID=UPI000F7F52D4|nr:2-oxo acid dehydrogenase subunit E2 [Candidatus Annandia adelgestsuga]